MQLMTQEIGDVLPKLGATDGQGEAAVARVKFFAPWSRWTWYATEYDSEQRVFFGLVVGWEPELGYFSLDELESLRGPGGLTVERDMFFQPVSLAECM